MGLDVLGHQLGFQGCTPQIVPLGFGIAFNGILQDCTGSEKGKMGTCWESFMGTTLQEHEFQCLYMAFGVSRLQNAQGGPFEMN